MKKHCIPFILLALSVYACNDSSGHNIHHCEGDACTDAKPVDPGQTDPQTGEQGQNDPQTGEQGQNEPQTGEQGQNEPQTGEQGQNEPQTGEQEQTDPQTGEQGQNNPQTGEQGQNDPDPAKPHPIDPIITNAPCTKDNETRCQNDGWHGFIERCVNGFWQKETSCGDNSCINEKECGECLGGTRTCIDSIMTWCQNGKLYQKQCNRCLDTGDICEYYDHEAFCQELTPGIGIEYIGDVWYTPYVCEGPCNAEGTSCDKNYHCTEGESYCFDEAYIIGGGASSIQQMTCRNGHWEYERCIMGCNADHSACIPVDNIDDLRCTDNEDGSYRSECYEVDGSAYLRTCDDGFWSPPRPCESRCNQDHTWCLNISTGACTEEGESFCKNDQVKNQHGVIKTCVNGEWIETESCGQNSCNGDHCGRCTNYMSQCVDGKEFIYCHQGQEYRVSCECNSMGCLSCQENENMTYCRDLSYGIGKLYTCKDGKLQTQDCPFSNGAPQACKADATGCN